jgi:hypothetical protein
MQSGHTGQMVVRSKTDAPSAEVVVRSSAFVAKGAPRETLRTSDDAYRSTQQATEPQVKIGHPRVPDVRVIPVRFARPQSL